MLSIVPSDDSFKGLFFTPCIDTYIHIDRICEFCLCGERERERERVMQSESVDHGNQRVRLAAAAAAAAADTRGKHRISAELKRLEQEARLLEEELEQLEKMETASASCKELLIIVETRPDPLLPVTNGPTNPYWDRWFEGPQDSQGCRCWIL